jgi:hypothetical protein
MNNLIPGRDRAVSVAALHETLTEESVRRHLLGREAYFRTRFIVARHGTQVAVVGVRRSSQEQLFAPIVDVELLASPDETAFVVAPEVDTTIPTTMAAAAVQLAPHARCVVVQGRYEHVSFIRDPRPLPVRVVELIPPEPAKLVDQVRRVLDVAEALPPVDVVPELIDIRELAAERSAEHYLFPCRGGGAAFDGVRVSYLDERPPRADWCLVGCTRSAQLHRWFYGDLPPIVSTCPRELARRTDRLSVAGTLTKCCLLEEGMDVEDRQVTVGWGATLAEVDEGVRQLTRSVEPVWAPA